MHYYLRRCDCFFSSNEEMLKYQMQNYSYKKPHYFDYIYNPSYDNTLNIPLKREEPVITKKPYVKEEIVVKKKPVTDTKSITEDVTHENIVR